MFQRKVLPIMIAIVLLISNFIIGPEKTDAATKYEYKVTASSLNVRSKASTSGKILGVVKKNEKLNVKKQVSNGWYEIVYKGKQGFVSGKYVSKKAISTTSTSNTTYTYTTTANLNVRTKASTSGKIITTLKKNTKLDVKKQVNSSWYEINYKGKKGYVSAKYVKKTKNVSKATSLTVSLNQQKAPLEYTFSASSKGAKTPYYEFSIYESGKWKKIKSYSSTSKVTWKPVKDGTYSYRVYVKDKDSSSSYDVKKEGSIKVQGVSSVLSATVSSKKVGTQFHFQVNSKGGRTPMHQFEILENGKWKVVQAYSTNAIYKWTPNVESKFRVLTKDKNSSKTYDVINEFIHTKTSLAQNIKTVTLQTKQANGANTIQLEAKSTGSSSPEYQFSVWKNGKWEVIQAYSSNRFATYTPEQKEKQKFKVTARHQQSQLAKSMSAEAVFNFNKVIVLDPGHGGSDPGATGINGTKEKAIALEVGKRAKAYFDKTPFDVYLTRSNDQYIELADRVSFAVEKKADAFVSIHLNSFESDSDDGTTTANGIETYYYNTDGSSTYRLQDAQTLRTTMSAKAYNPYPSESKDLASSIQKRLVEFLKLRDRGVKHGNYHVIRENEMPAVLAELGFINNKNDYNVLSKTQNQDLAAKAIYYGVLDYLGANGENVKGYY